jgi:hypothetical protein
VTARHRRTRRRFRRPSADGRTAGAFFIAAYASTGIALTYSWTSSSDLSISTPDTSPVDDLVDVELTDAEQVNGLASVGELPTRPLTPQMTCPYP